MVVRMFTVDTREAQALFLPVADDRRDKDRGGENSPVATRRPAAVCTYPGPSRTSDVMQLLADSRPHLPRKRGCHAPLLRIINYTQMFSQRRTSYRKPKQPERTA